MSAARFTRLSPAGKARELSVLNVVDREDGDDRHARRGDSDPCAGRAFRVVGRQHTARHGSGQFGEPAHHQTVRVTVVSPAAPSEGEGDRPSEAGAQPLPTLAEGTKVTCQGVVVSEKRTTAPKRFTEASLIQTMTGIGRYVTDPKITQLLRETDGIGTPATQANIIETLVERRFVERRAGQILSTAVGRALVAVLPDATTRPDMTARWEAAMRRVADGQAALAAFLSSVEKELRSLITRDRARGRLEVPPQETTASETEIAADEPAGQVSIGVVADRRTRWGSRRQLWLTGGAVGPFLIRAIQHERISVRPRLLAELGRHGSPLGLARP